MNWIPGLPDIPKGTRKQFIVKGVSYEGKVFVTAAFYMNGHVMPCNMDSEAPPPPQAVPHNPDEDGWSDEYEWTGWSLGRCDYCDCEWMEDLNIIAYMPMPDAGDDEFPDMFVFKSWLYFAGK